MLRMSFAWPLPTYNRGSVRRTLSRAALFLLAVLILPAASRAAVQPLEYEVKAAYIFNLANFTTWPPAAFATPATALEVCVADPNPFGDLLVRTFQGEQVGGHPVIVVVVKDPAAVRACHV